MTPSSNTHHRRDGVWIIACIEAKSRNVEVSDQNRQTRRPMRVVRATVVSHQYTRNLKSDLKYVKCPQTRRFADNVANVFT